MSVDDGKARDATSDAQFAGCHWSSQQFDLRASSSTDVPVQFLNQPTICYKAVATKAFSCTRLMEGSRGGIASKDKLISYHKT